MVLENHKAGITELSTITHKEVMSTVKKLFVSQEYLRRHPIFVRDTYYVAIGPEIRIRFDSKEQAEAMFDILVDITHRGEEAEADHMALQKAVEILYFKEEQ